MKDAKREALGRQVNAAMTFMDRSALILLAIEAERLEADRLRKKVLGLLESGGLPVLLMRKGKAIL